VKEKEKTKEQKFRAQNFHHNYHASVMLGCVAMTGVFTDFLVRVPLSISLPRGERFL